MSDASNGDYGQNDIEDDEPALSPEDDFPTDADIDEMEEERLIELQIERDTFNGNSSAV